MSTLAVVLAAGEGARFRGSGGKTHKLLADFRGRPIVRWAVEHALAADLDETVVVQGGISVDDVVPDGVTVITNREWRRGKATSLQVAVRCAERNRHDAIVVGLGDQPLISPAAWRAVAAATMPITAATYRGQRGHPVRLAAEVWLLLPSTGESGAVVVMRDHPHLVGEIACEGDSVDIDTVEDLEQWS